MEATGLSFAIKNMSVAYYLWKSPPSSLSAFAQRVHISDP